MMTAELELAKWHWQQQHERSGLVCISNSGTVLRGDGRSSSVHARIVLSKNIRRLNGLNVTEAGDSRRSGCSDKSRLCVYLSIRAVKEKRREQSTLKSTDI